MENKVVAFFDAKPYDRRFFDEINRQYGFAIRYIESRLNSQTVKLAEGADVVCVFVNDSVDKAVIEKLHNYGVGLIALRCSGYNNVDFEAAFNTIHVVRVPVYSPYAVAEHAAALLLALNRKTHKSYYRTRDGNFSITGLIGFDLHDKTAGIIGTGQIGRVMAGILKGFGMTVLGFDAYPDEKAAEAVGFEYADIETLYSGSDIISLHCPLTPETYHMINEESIGRMKDGVYIINTGRGRLIDTQALIDALKRRKVGAAGLDVYEEESEFFYEDFSAEVISDDRLARLLTFSNVLITSHQGFFTTEGLSNIARTTLDNIGHFYSRPTVKNEICYRCTKNGHECRRKKEGRCF